MKLIKVTQVYYETYFNEFGNLKKQRKERELYINPNYIMEINYDETQGVYIVNFINKETIYITMEDFNSKLKEYLY